MLLPVRNAAATLGECLASLAAQTLRDHEVVAVDDGSTDHSAEILERTAVRDRRVRLVRGPHRGLVAALTTAVDQARGRLLARMDADDVAAPERLRLQVRRLEGDAGVDVLGCRVRLVGGMANAGMRAYVAWQNRLLDHDAIVRDLLVESPLIHPSVMMAAAAFRRIGGYRSFDGPEDYDLWLRARAAGLRFAKLKETLLLWRDGPRRLTRTDPRYAPGRFRALKLHSLEAGPLRERRGVVVWGAGPIGKSWAADLRRRGHDVAAFVEVDPKKFGQRIHGIPVVDVPAAGRLPGLLHLAAVGRPGARERIRAEARRLGLEHDLIAVA